MNKVTDHTVLLKTILYMKNATFHKHFATILESLKPPKKSLQLQLITMYTSSKHKIRMPSNLAASERQLKNPNFKKP